MPTFVPGRNVVAASARTWAAEWRRISRPLSESRVVIVISSPSLTGADKSTSLSPIGPGLVRAAIAGRIGDREVDLSAPVREGDEITITTLDSERGLEILRHSAAHVLAEAATTFRPGTKVGIGPAIDQGFYYDFQFSEPMGEDDLPQLQ